MKTPGIAPAGGNIRGADTFEDMANLELSRIYNNAAVSAFASGGDPFSAGISALQNGGTSESLTALAERTVSLPTGKADLPVSEAKPLAVANYFGEGLSSATAAGGVGIAMEGANDDAGVSPLPMLAVIAGLAYFYFRRK